jgi:hypothetical protein
MADELIFERDRLLELERDAFARWSASIEGLPPDARRGDGWTLLEVVAHVAAWHRFAAMRLGALARDEVTEAPDADEFNARVRQETAGRAWDEVRAEAEAARAAYLVAVEAASDETLRARDGLGAFIVGANGSWHYEEHLEDFAARES